VYFRAAFTAHERDISFLLQLCVKNTFWFQLRQCQIFLFFVALSHSSGKRGFCSRSRPRQMSHGRSGQCVKGSPTFFAAISLKSADDAGAQGNSTRKRHGILMRSPHKPVNITRNPDRSHSAERGVRQLRNVWPSA
jgi:hypothetical protein